jgi:hypothetical protein
MHPDAETPYPDFELLKICTFQYYKCHILSFLHNLDYKGISSWNFTLVERNIVLFPDFCKI